MTRIKKGGAVIGEGGFGCVFKPALKCKNKNKRSVGVSKLLLTRDATQEYTLLKNIERKISRINNNSKYFLLYELSMCKPDELTYRDMENFNEKCKLFNKKKSASNNNSNTRKNINKDINKLRIINMPYGGIELTRILERIQYNSDYFHKLNTNMANLLKYGIEPMNKLNVFHTDLKSSNILIQEKDGLPRIIDWGSALIDDGELPPQDGRPIQFNQPFSLVIIYPTFLKEYEKFLREKSIINLSNIEDKKKVQFDFLPKFYLDLLKKNSGHHSHMINMYNNILYNNELGNDEANIMFVKLIIDYMIEILDVYTKNGKFDVEDYFFKVFLKTTDIWGFVCCYEQVPEFIRKSNITEEDKSYLINKVRELFKIIISSPTKVVNVDDLVKILDEMYIKHDNSNTNIMKTIKFNSNIRNKTRKKRSN